MAIESIQTANRRLFFGSAGFKSDDVVGQFNSLFCKVTIYLIHRAMQFIFAVLHKVSEGMDGNKAAKEAYYETLSRHHGFVIKKAFQIGLMTAPSTEAMLAFLGPDKVSCSTPAAPQNISSPIFQLRE
jgi:hypothetical protein